MKNIIFAKIIIIIILSNFNILLPTQNSLKNASQKNQIKGIKKLQNKLHLTTSIIIPCHSQHAEHLYSLLESFQAQTTHPNEIIISLSNAQNVPINITQQIQDQKWPFKVELILSNDQKSASENRNMACNKAMGDILICQDADDLPHQQRIEIIKYFFENYPISHLLHGMTNNPQKFKTFNNLNKVKWKHYTDYALIARNKITIANGPAAFRKYVFEKIKYDESFKAEVKAIGEDAVFNNNVYVLFKNNIIILEDIYFYNWIASTHHGWDKN